MQGTSRESRYKTLQSQNIARKLSVHLRFDGDGPNRFINAHHNYRLHVFFRCFMPKIAMIFATQDTHVVFSRTAWSNRGTTFRTTWWRHEKACWSNVNSPSRNSPSVVNPHQTTVLRILYRVIWRYVMWRASFDVTSCDVTARAPCDVTSRAFWGSLWMLKEEEIEE